MLLHHIKQGFRKLKKVMSAKFYIAVAVILCFSIVALPILAISENLAVHSKTEKIDQDKSGEFADLYNGTFNTISFLAPMYSKLKTRDIFGNDSRDNIYNIINTTPGITMGSITRVLKLKNGTVTHHLRILEREGYIKSKKCGKFRRYYVIGTKASGLNEIQDKIVEKVQQRPGISQSELGRELQLSRQLVNYHVKDLVEHRAIKAEKIGNKCCCFSNGNGNDEIRSDNNYYY
jgi:DNA-binding MarR family transcriptional regulator